MGSEESISVVITSTDLEKKRNAMSYKRTETANGLDSESLITEKRIYRLS